jgi:hypothetical protein
MASAPQVAVCTRNPIQHDPEPVLRTLRWSYVREGDLIVCALGLTSDHAAYELRISPPLFLGLSFELFDDAISAFQRQAAFERALLAEGWLLERFEHGSRLAV